MLFKSSIPADTESSGRDARLLEAVYSQGLSAHFDVKPKPLFSILDEPVMAHPTRPCLDFSGRKYTYGELGTLVAKVTKGFQALGVRKGIRVGLFMPNSPYFVICYYAILKAGGTVVNFNPLYAEREIAHQIEDSDTRIMVTLDLKDTYPKAAAQLAGTCLEKVVVCRVSRALPFPDKILFPLLKRKDVAAIPTTGEQHIAFEKLTANDGNYEQSRIDPERDLAVLQYTGGKTGRPKGAMLTHANLYVNTVQTQVWTRDIWSKRDGQLTMVAVLPLFQVFGMTTIMNLGLQLGGEIMLLPRFKAGELLSVIDEVRPTVLIAVPSVYLAMSEHKDRVKYDLSSLKLCFSGGAPLSTEVRENFQRLVKCHLVEGYGLTEASSVCTMAPVSGPHKPGSVGLPLPGTAIEIVSLEQPDTVLPHGRQGEICVSGPQVMAGYWKQPGETNQVVCGGRLHTGDLGYLDQDGYLFLTGRIKNLIITSAFKVYPLMVEEAIRLHPGVEEVTVYGASDRYRGETVSACVELHPGARLTASELRTFLKDKLAVFETPRDIVFRQTDASP